MSLLRPAAFASRSFVIEVVPDRYLDVFDPHFPRTVSQTFLSGVLQMMEQFRHNLFLTVSRGPGVRAEFQGKFRDDCFILRMDMPGLSIEDVKVYVEYGVELHIKGVFKESVEEGGGGCHYASAILFEEDLYKIDQIKTEMKNGVLKVVVPKVAR